MSKPLVPTRKNKDGKTEYYCHNCEAWVTGYIWWGRDYPQLICDGCDTDLDDEPIEGDEGGL
jgi:hypothetical protein